MPVDKRVFLGIICFFSWCMGSSQNTDFGGLLEAEYCHELGRNWEIIADGELRLNHNFTQYKRSKIGVGIDYRFLFERLKIGATFHYINANECLYFESRYRVNATLVYSEKIRRFKLSYRARLEATFYDERIAEHHYNPKMYVRNRLEVKYNFFSKPIALYVSTEFFCRLYHPEKSYVDNWRTIIGLSYRIDKRNSLHFFLRSDNEVQVKNRLNVYYVGFGYHFQ